MSYKSPSPFAVYCAPPKYEEPLDSLHELINEIKIPSENDQSRRNWELQWKTGLKVSLKSSIHSKKEEILEYISRCTFLAVEEIKHKDFTLDLFFDLIYERENNDLEAIHRKLQNFQVLILSKHYVGYSNPVLKDALGDEFQGHDDVSEGKLSDLTSLDSDIEMEDGTKSGMEVLLQKCNDCLEITFLSLDHSELHWTMSTLTLQPKGHWQRCILDQPRFPTKLEAIKLIKHDILSNVLVELRNIPKATYNTQKWRQLVQESHLDQTIMHITNPQYLLRYASDERFTWRVEIHREMVLRFALANFLQMWSPKDLQKSWVANPLQYQPMQPGSVSFPESAAGFFSILAEKQILQVEAFTFSVLFLLGKYSNFDYWWQHSIAPALSFHNYKVIHVNFRELEGLEREFPGLKGGGVSRVNGDKKPVSCGAHTIYTPEQLHLERVYQDQAKVTRCGKHVWVPTTGDPNKPRQPNDKVEMVIYNAWTQNVVEKLVKNNNTSSNVSALNRQNNVEGSMEAFGNRVPMSGGTGDGLRAYKGIDATTTRGVDEIFNKAEDSMAMQEVARYLDPDLFRDLEKMTADSEKLGRLGSTLFTAHGYIALQHLERSDLYRSFCSQLAWRAERKWDEFGFVYAQMGYYIATEANMLW
ncbi:hypothetical protein BT96DRAFT_1019806 [Gymnopus androsaceus JB14]|uniref:Uncharacterized protein n=1 Tax=Gymnopus androsaceus JB14 TaxID=1447944 RepID=A0A6A4HQ72_9AGAR|nr:hypothetical protein BT96DRAFT_1019806 [Gymnopus androsaceus JB14]